MTNLIQTTSRKSAAATAAEERVLRARAGHAAFSRSFADMAGNTFETGPRAVAFITSLGGASNMPEVTAERSAKKADVLDALPVNARKAAAPYDDGTKDFIAAVYRRSAEVKGHVDFTATEAGKIMNKEPESARRTVEALVSRGVFAPHYSGMGRLDGYLPGITD